MNTLVKSFDEYYQSELEKLFLQEGFAYGKYPMDGINGILNIIDALSDYHEEGVPLNPEILLINDLDKLKKRFKSLESIKIGDFVIGSAGDFDRILKLTAPIANQGWIIYIQYNPFSSPPYVEYGIINGELNELSPTISDQIFEKSVLLNQELSCIFIRNIGQKGVFLKGLRGNSITFSFTTSRGENSPFDSIEKLAGYITTSVDKRIKNNAKKYIQKLIFRSINKGHGTLIGVTSMNIFSDGNIPISGNPLDVPVNLISLIESASSQKAIIENHYSLSKYSYIIDSVINNDGITIFSDKGELIGYHFLIQKKSTTQNSGGSRTQAFEAMKESGLFECCFFKSQDGKTKIWEKERKAKKIKKKTIYGKK